MSNLIDKDTLVAEIERLVSNGKLKCQQSKENNDQVSYITWSEHIATLGKIISLLDTLEVKEVDLEEVHYKPLDEDFERDKENKVMTKEEKELLLKYLCMALPYDVMVDYESHINILNEIDLACKDIDYITVRIQDVERLMCAKSVMIENIRPYLRSMSGMTEEERNEYNAYLFYGSSIGLMSNTTTAYELINWLLENHFDFMELIPKDLAIEVTEDNNPYKD